MLKHFAPVGQPAPARAPQAQDKAADGPKRTMPLRFCSWNANSLRQRASNNAAEMQSFFARGDYDIIAVQETKMIRSDLDDPDVYRLVNEGVLSGYRRFWDFNDKRSAGVLTLVRRDLAVLGRSKCLSAALADARTGMDGPDNSGGRFTALLFPDLLLVNTYVPNCGNTESHFERRREWQTAIEARLAQLRALYDDRPLLWLGDLNVAWGEGLDVSHPGWFATRFRTPNGDDAFTGQPGYKRWERDTFAECTARLGLLDAFRELHGPALRKYSWGGQRGGLYDGKGMRIDYTMISAAHMGLVRAADIFERESMGSDHRPISLELSPLDEGAGASASADADSGPAEEPAGAGAGSGSGAAGAGSGAAGAGSGAAERPAKRPRGD